MKRTGLTKEKAELLMLLVSIVCLTATVFVTAKAKKTSAARAFCAPATISQNNEVNEEEKIQVRLFPKKDEKQKDTAEKRDDKISLFAKQSNSPTILIYHTHTLEAYTQTSANTYKESSGRWRTNDESKSVVAVGEALAEELRDMGFNVIHDTTDHEPPKLSTAYERSLLTMLSYKKKYPEISLYIDLHRDAADEDNTKDYCIIDGKETARVMFVVGHGNKFTGDEKPDFDANYKAAELVTEYLQSIDPSLARSIREKPGRYNQHVGDCCMLIEIGHNMNTLEQALAAVPYVAEGICRLYE